MLQFLAVLAAGVWAADTGKVAAPPQTSALSVKPEKTPEPVSVFELSVHAALKENGQKAHDAVENRLRAAGGAEALTGRPDKVAFSFGRGRPAELRKRLLRGIDALADAGALSGEKEAFYPSLNERKVQAVQELKALRKERAALAAALKKAPVSQGLVDKRLEYLESFDPAKEERQSILLVYIDRPKTK